jgi:ubiquinone/menaquinone biosynthesis C-methylase UbiE
VAGNNEIVVDAFTEMAPNYEGTVDRELTQFWGVGYRDFIVRFLQPIQLQGHDRVLDIGTGMAMVPTTLLKDTHWLGEVVGVDITPSMLAGARKSLEGSGANSRIRLVCGSGMVLPFHDHSFDAVTCALATHHMDVPVLLREVHRVLRPGGRFLVADVGLASFWGTRWGRIWIGVIAALYSTTQGKMRVRAELDAMKNMLAPETWHSLLVDAEYTEINTQVLSAKRRWYPPGVLIDCHSSVQSGHARR